MLVTKSDNKRVDLSDLLQKLGKQGIDSLLLEGGSQLNFSFVEKGLINRVHCYIAPKLLGGITAKTPVGGTGIPQLAQALKLKTPKIEIVGQDVLLDFEIEN